MKSSKEMFESVQEKARAIKISKRKQAKRLAVCAVALVLAVGITVGVCVPLLSVDNGGGNGGANIPVAYAVSGFDSTEWDETTNKWTEVVDYDVDLSAYPDSITRYLAYQMETRDENVRFWAYLNPINAYFRSVFIDDDYLIDKFVETVNSIDTQNVFFNYTDSPRSVDRQNPCGAYVLWTADEIKSLAELYQELFPDDKYSGESAGISICATKNLKDKNADKFDAELYGAYYCATDDEYLPVNIQIKIPVKQSYDWNDVGNIYQYVIKSLPKSDIFNDEKYTVSTYVGVRNSSRSKFEELDGYYYVFENVECINRLQLKVGNVFLLRDAENEELFMPKNTKYWFGEQLLSDLSESTKATLINEMMSDTRFYNEILGSETYVNVMTTTVLTKKQIENLLTSDLSDYVVLYLAAGDLFDEDIQSKLFAKSTFGNSYSIEQAIN